MNAPDVDVDRVLDMWSLPGPRAITPTAGGFQNRTSYVSCRSGEFVLRLYTNVADPSSQRFEHELLGRLAVAGLPFATPQPVPSDNGDTLRTIDGRLAALFVRIPGEPAREDDPVARRAGATALAEVDTALAAIERFDAAVPSFDGRLQAMHPLVHDLDVAALESGLPGDEALRLARELDEIASLAGPLYASLPHQVTHADFGFGNLLLAGERVTGYLDFEHSGWDVRAMDLAVGLFRWPPLGAIAMERCEEFGSVYSARLALDPVELAALPALMRLRAGVSFVHWTGRRRAGLATGEETLRRARRALFVSDWAERHGEVLVARALGWVGIEV